MSKKQNDGSRKRKTYVKVDGRDLDDAAQLGEESDGRARLQVRVQILLERRRLDHGGKVGEDARRVAYLRQHVDFQVGRERVGQAHVARKGRQDQIPHLDAVGRDDVAEAVVVVAQEFGKVVQQDEQDAQRALVQHRDGLAELGVAQERRQEFEQVDEQLGVHAPALLLRSDGQQAADEDPVRHDFQPGVGEAGRFGRP